jgi:anti-sigma factor RsiW
MNCTEYEADANAFIDGELALREQIELFKHLGQCPACSSFVDVAMRVKEAHRKEQIAFPPQLDDAVLSAVMNDPANRQAAMHRTSVRPMVWGRTFHFSGPILAAAAIVLIAAGFFLNGLFYGQKKALVPVQVTEYVGQTAAQPEKIIVVYSLPPVEVHAKLPAESTSNHIPVQY